jgi:hypothetical protein
LRFFGRRAAVEPSGSTAGVAAALFTAFGFLTSLFDRFWDFDMTGVPSLLN